MRTLNLSPKYGTIVCSNCNEHTNPAYIHCQNFVCWNCGNEITGTHAETIRDLYAKLFPRHKGLMEQLDEHAKEQGYHK